MCVLNPQQRLPVWAHSTISWPHQSSGAKALVPDDFLKTQLLHKTRMNFETTMVMMKVNLLPVNARFFKQTKTKIQAPKPSQRHHSQSLQDQLCEPPESGVCRTSSPFLIQTVGSHVSIPTLDLDNVFRQAHQYLTPSYIFHCHPKNFEALSKSG